MTCPLSLHGGPEVLFCFYRESKTKKKKLKIGKMWYSFLRQLQRSKHSLVYVLGMWAVYQSLSSVDAPCSQGSQLPVPMREMPRSAPALAGAPPTAARCANRWTIGMALQGTLLIVFLLVPLMSLYIFYDFDSDAMLPGHFPSTLLSACIFFFWIQGEWATLNLPFSPSETLSACQEMVKKENIWVLLFKM